MEGNPIHINNWVKTVTKGQFDANQGRATEIKTWVIFEGSKGLKQVREPKKLIIKTTEHIRVDMTTPK